MDLTARMWSHAVLTRPHALYVVTSHCIAATELGDYVNPLGRARTIAPMPGLDLARSENDALRARTDVLRLPPA